MGSKLFRQFSRISTSFWYDTRGMIVPYVTVLLVAIVGVSLLALDGGRAYSLQTQLQNIADAAALAGAAELNRAPGARTRATNAINNLISNRLAGMDVTDVTLDTPIKFYETLPQADQYFSSGTESPDDGHARFVAVTLSHTMNTIFPVNFLNPGGTNGYTAGAQAVAGNDIVACKYTPMFICNPYETNAMSYDEATAALQNASTGNLVALQGASNAQYSPGNFGWIEPEVLGTAADQCGSGNSVAQAAAQTRPPTCFRNTAIDTHPGNITPATDGLNTRFDLYGNGSFNSCNANLLYPPAPNVRKGYTGNSACNVNQAGVQPGNGNAMGLPLDNNMLTNGQANSVLNGNGQWTCGNITSTVSNVSHNIQGNDDTVTLTLSSNTTGLFNGMTTTATGIPSATFVNSVPSSTTVTIVGRSNAPGNITVASGATIQFNGYWSTAHPTGTNGANSPPAGCTAPATISRESVYQYELDTGYLNDASLGGEIGAPRCSSSSPDPSRRYLNVAILNCLGLEREGYSLQGSATGLPVVAFAKYFMTLPVASSSSAIYAEYKGIINPQSSGGDLYSQVQLYR